MIGTKHPYRGMTKTKKKRKNKKAPGKKLKKLYQVKTIAPGVPPITCPYIDFTLNTVSDIVEAYEHLLNTGETTPTTMKKEEVIKEAMELVRAHAEGLRESSLYWYQEYKALDKKYTYYVKKGTK